jgi:hypothetical protein
VVKASTLVKWWISLRASQSNPESNPRNENEDAVLISDSSPEDHIKQIRYGGVALFRSLMADETLIGRVHELSDLELATLICLVAQEHCIIDTDPVALDDLVQELELVRSMLSHDKIVPVDSQRWHRRSLVFLAQWSIALNILHSMTSHMLYYLLKAVQLDRTPRSEHGKTPTSFTHRLSHPLHVLPFRRPSQIIKRWPM